MKEYPENMILLALIWFFIIYIIAFRHPSMEDKKTSFNIPRYIVALLFAIPLVLFYPDWIFILHISILSGLLFVLELMKKKIIKNYLWIVLIQIVITFIVLASYEWGIEKVGFEIIKKIEKIIANGNLLWVIFGYILCLSPANLVIKSILNRFDITIIDKVNNQAATEQQKTEEESLVKAGRFIGALERIITLSLVLIEQYEAIGFLVASKSILRMNEGNKGLRRSEYILAGTLLSFGLAILIGLVLLKTTEN